MGFKYKLMRSKSRKDTFGLIEVWLPSSATVDAPTAPAEPSPTPEPTPPPGD